MLDIPESQHVLVVYKEPIDENDSLGIISEAIMNYYKNARIIPASNIVGIYLPDTTVTIDGETHIVGLAQETDIIRDFYQDSIKAGTPTFHAWQYFLDNIVNIS